MPIYEFQCEACGAVTEVRESIAAGQGTHACPQCGSGAMRKLLSAFAVSSAEPSFDGGCEAGDCPMPGGDCGMGGGCPCFDD